MDDATVYTTKFGVPARMLEDSIHSIPIIENKHSFEIQPDEGSGVYTSMCEVCQIRVPAEHATDYCHIMNCARLGLQEESSRHEGCSGLEKTDRRGNFRS